MKKFTAFCLVTVMLLSLLCGYALLSTTDNTAGPVHIDTETAAQTVCEAADSFTVNSGAVSFALPVISPDTYTVVAYISTADGIRASGYVPLSFGEVSGEEIKADNMTVTAEKSDNGSICITYEESRDIYTSLTADTALGYSELYGIISQEVYKYGTPLSQTLEIYDEQSESFVQMSGEEQTVSEGVYRMAYISNTDGAAEAYLYAQFTSAVTEEQ